MDKRLDFALSGGIVNKEAKIAEINLKAKKLAFKNLFLDYFVKSLFWPKGLAKKHSNIVVKIRVVLKTLLFV